MMPTVVILPYGNKECAGRQLYANLRELLGMEELSITGASLEKVPNELISQTPALDGVILYL
jgi:hypothetical protein